MKFTVEQKIQIRGMAIDLAIRSGATGDGLVAKAEELYNFILKDLQEAPEQAAKVVSLV